MSDDLDSFFGAPDPDDPLERDQWGRPKLVPTAAYPGLDRKQRKAARDGVLKVPYTRASTMSDYIANFKGLHTWEKRRLAWGLAQREDLCAMAASLPKFHNDRKKDLAQNRALDEIIALAMEIGQVHEQANTGTAYHGFTTPTCCGHGQIPERMVDDVQVFFDNLRKAGIKIERSETFVANDRLKVAGTFDHIIYVPGRGRILADTKTGDFKPVEFAIQLACYRDGEIYDPETNTRTPLPDDLDADWAAVLWIRPGKQRVELRWIDLNFGRKMAAICAQVRDGHQMASKVATKDDFPALIEAYEAQQQVLRDTILGMEPDRDAFLEMREEHADWWDKSLDALCKERLQAATPAAAAV